MLHLILRVRCRSKGQKPFLSDRAYRGIGMVIMSKLQYVKIVRLVKSCWFRVMGINKEGRKSDNGMVRTPPYEPAQVEQTHGT